MNDTRITLSFLTRLRERALLNSSLRAARGGGAIIRDGGVMGHSIVRLMTPPPLRGTSPRCAQGGTRFSS